MMPLRVQYGILKIMCCILCKTEGSRPYSTHFSTTNKCFVSIQIYNYQQLINTNRIRASMIATLSFLLKIYIIPVPFYWRNDTPTFLSPDGFHPQISLSLRLLVLCLVFLNLFVIHYSLFIFSKSSFLSLLP